MVLLRWVLHTFNKILHSCVRRNAVSTIGTQVAFIPGIIHGYRYALLQIRRTGFLVLLLCFFLVISRTAASEPACGRIISLAPSITETLNALGLVDNIVGVTRFDNFPEQVSKLPKVGSFLDLNLEFIISLRPSVIFAPAESVVQIRALSNLGLNTVSVDQRTLSLVDHSITMIGNICGLQERSENVLKEIKSQTASFRDAAAGKKPVRGLIVIGADKDKLYISGTDGFYNELFEIIGIKNVFSGKTSSFMAISEEGILRLAPEIVIEIGEPGSPSIAEKFLAASKLESIRALKGRLVFINEYFASIPGPRYPELLKIVMKLLPAVQAG